MNFPVTTYSKLTSQIKSFTKVTTIPSATGCALISESGARILGLFPAMDSYNTLWTAPDIETLIREKKSSIGGERLWIAPQRDFFFKKPLSFEGYCNQNSIDPGDYHQISDSLFKSDVTIEDFNLKSEYKTNCTRQFNQLKDPYNTNLPFAGVKILDTITIDEPRVDFCAWSLSQVYTAGPSQPGTAVIPIVNNGTFIEYFTKTPLHCFNLQDKAAYFRIDSIYSYKIGISPIVLSQESTIKAAYISSFPDSNKWFLVVKRSDDLPTSQDECVDVSSLDPNGDKGAVQVYNSFYSMQEKFKPFGEIELHFKSGRVNKGLVTSKGTHELLSYTGCKDELLKLLGLMLCTNVDPLHLF